MRVLSAILTLCVVLNSGQGISTKVDFEDESTATNSSKIEDGDVEVKHTIVVSTKLKNSNGNRRGLHINEEDGGHISYNNVRKENPVKDDDEVPIILGYKGIETTEIRTPDTRFKPPTPSYPESVFISRNIRDDYDIYPNLASNPAQWRPSSFFNNINYWNHDHARDTKLVRRIDRPYQNHGKNWKETEDSMKDFYCRKCREMNGFKGCGQGSRPWETTTAKIKIDGKLAKLN